ncbi:hypothetical protein SAMN05421819_1627 [Bryocella elongata]|uniref:Dolichyl-phosphate-mannose-protein mannosyltransferase n=1 Tax=Bryocella elongata TaxID=863522 RepID=A0A1H5WL57_9BACT|nr:hypothetical protein [Bryocella elongata]SEG00010.1 hypothetical protein SAMN05421819_1627 [Bryocella elongata]
MPSQNPVLPWRYRSVALGIVVAGALVWSIALGRFDPFYTDNPFFSVPALRASLGFPFTYQVSVHAPFVDSLWAYHGPLLPHLLAVLYRWFGFSRAMASVPNFVGGWLAALLLVGFLIRRGYAQACLIFAVLWVGDRAVLEILYARMEGLALLFAAIGLILAVEAAESSSRLAAALCGISCGLALLSHPLCATFSLAAGGSFLLRRQFAVAAFFVLGLALDLLLLLKLWGFRPHDAVRQFLWHAGINRSETHGHGIRSLLGALRWSEGWVACLIVFSIAMAMVIGARSRTEMALVTGTALDLQFLAAYSLFSVPLLFMGATFPYYLVYASIWPLLALAVLLEREWPRWRLAAAVLFVFWLGSVAWNLSRLREQWKFHRALSAHLLVAEVTRDVPEADELMVGSDLYAIPVEAGHRRFALASQLFEPESICAHCYLLVRQRDLDLFPEFAKAALVGSREMLYDGPVFPDGGGSLNLEKVLLLGPVRGSAAVLTGSAGFWEGAGRPR